MTTAATTIHSTNPFTSMDDEEEDKVEEEEEASVASVVAIAAPVAGPMVSVSATNEEEDDDDDQDDEEAEDEDDDDDDDDDEEEEEEEEDEENNDDDEDDEDEEDENEDSGSNEDEDDEDTDADTDLVDPGQHCHQQLQHTPLLSPLTNCHSVNSSAPSTNPVNHHNHHHHHHHHNNNDRLHLQAHQQQQMQQLHDQDLINEPRNDSIATTNRDQQQLVGDDILDGERMLEVTRKLVRNTERDPDRDLRKQVLLKTAIKKLPHFMDYNHRYSDNLDTTSLVHSNVMSPQAYYHHHDSQPKFYHSVQPNAIQMSTTSLRMLDLNDDHDPELVNIDQDQNDLNLGFNSNNTNTTTSLDQHDYVSQLSPIHRHQNPIHNTHHQQQHQNESNHHHQNNQYDRYHQRTNELNHFETNGPMLSRHNSLDNLYQPINGSDLNEDMKDGSDERIPIAFQIACEIYDFTCTPDDNDRKLLDNLTNGYYTTTRPHTNELRSNTVIDDGGGEDGTDTREQLEGSDTSSSSHSSSSDESATSIVSQSDEANVTSLLDVSLNSSNDYYHSSHDSGVSLFSPRSNKRSSSSIGLDDEMEIDHLTELTTHGPNIGSNNQYKKLRKREIID